MTWVCVSAYLETTEKRLVEGSGGMRRTEYTYLIVATDLGLLLLLLLHGYSLISKPRIATSRDPCYPTMSYRDDRSRVYIYIPTVVGGFVKWNRDTLWQVVAHCSQCYFFVGLVGCSISWWIWGIWKYKVESLFIRRKILSRLIWGNHAAVMMMIDSHIGYRPPSNSSQSVLLKYTLRYRHIGLCSAWDAWDQCTAEEILKYVFKNITKMIFTLSLIGWSALKIRAQWWGFRSTT